MSAKREGKHLLVYSKEQDLKDKKPPASARCSEIEAGGFVLL
jgi:hypothetical protein